MTLRFGSIVIHKPDPNSEADNSNLSSDDAEVAEVAETATTKYNNNKMRRQAFVRRADRQRRTISKSRSMESVSSSESGSEVSILRILNGDRSPPLVRSHYYQQAADERLQNNKVFSQRNLRKTSSADCEPEMNIDRLGFRMSANRSRTTDKANDRRCASSVVPDMISSFTTPFVPIIDDEAAINGLSKLLKNLNFAEKLRQQKAEQQRLDINKLPRHMREQLKHIYVY